MSDQWATQFQGFIQNPPKTGDILRAVGGLDIKIRVDLIQGKPPFMYGLAYVPTLVGCELGWFCRNIDDPCTYGWKLIPLPKAQEQIIRKVGIVGKVHVKALRIVRPSKKGKSFLVEVAEF